MLMLLWMEDPVKGVFSLEIISLCGINADIGLIATEGSPDFSSALAKGNSRTPIFSAEEMGPAKQAPNHPNWESRSVGG